MRGPRKPVIGEIWDERNRKMGELFAFWGFLLGSWGKIAGCELSILLFQIFGTGFLKLPGKLRMACQLALEELAGGCLRMSLH